MKVSKVSQCITVSVRDLLSREDARRLNCCAWGAADGYLTFVQLFEWRDIRYGWSVGLDAFEKDLAWSCGLGLHPVGIEGENEQV